MASRTYAMSSGWMVGSIGIPLGDCVTVCWVGATGGDRRVPKLVLGSTCCIAVGVTTGTKLCAVGRVDIDDLVLVSITPLSW
jgi:hypothetical protein